MSLIFALLIILLNLLWWGVVICLGAAILAFPFLVIGAAFFRKSRPD